MSETPDTPTPHIRVGISSCLLGEEVRFDGGHKRDAYILGTLGRFFELVPVCPEVGIGLGTPRQPIRLMGDPAAPRAVGSRDPSLDVTDRLIAYGQRKARELHDLSGYILKSRSPSCGMERVKVYAASGQPGRPGSGLYARALMEALPLLPVEEEGRLGDPVLRENFVERVFAYRRWQDLEALGVTRARLVAFHTVHKLTLMAHGEERYRALGRLVGEPGRRSVQALADEYIEGFMAALKYRATRRRHSNVLMHLMGYLKRHLDSGDKAELLEVIDAYRRGLLPLVVPVTLLKHHFRRHPDPYVDKQVYLSPHPDELMLRNAL
jgi:uncharacterized protein YbgA (DUF1722 family)/uncharacterized protein YbbK (DUF523 family)